MGDAQSSYASQVSINEVMGQLKSLNQQVGDAKSSYASEVSINEVMGQLKSLNQQMGDVKTTTASKSSISDILGQLRTLNDTKSSHASEVSINEVMGQLRALREDMLPSMSPSTLDRLVSDVSSAVYDRIRVDWDTRSTEQIEILRRINHKLSVPPSNLEEIDRKLNSLIPKLNHDSTRNHKHHTSTIKNLKSILTATARGREDTRADLHRLCSDIADSVAARIPPFGSSSPASSPPTNSVIEMLDQRSPAGQAIQRERDSLAEQFKVTRRPSAALMALDNLQKMQSKKRASKKLRRPISSKPDSIKTPPSYNRSPRSSDKGSPSSATSSSTLSRFTPIRISSGGSKMAKRQRRWCAASMNRLYRSSLDHNSTD
eukprot:GHVH01003124.1.p1 GENE.GHVH01003124.1~~GHVH01003124.1.p1  ORF type:complete len:374 (-),score=59.34 GHVH01003124.1:1157-2278(-)